MSGLFIWIYLDDLGWTEKMGKEKGNEEEGKELKAKGTIFKCRWVGMLKIDIFLFQQGRISSSSSAKLLRIQSCHFLFCHLSLKAIIFFGLFICCCLSFPTCMPSAVHVVSVVGWSPTYIFQETCHLARNLLRKKPSLGWQRRMQVLIIIFSLLRPSTGTFMRHKILVWM